MKRPMTDDLWLASGTHLPEHIWLKEFSPVELVKVLLERIDSYNDRVNAFVHMTPDLAHDMA